MRAMPRSCVRSIERRPPCSSPAHTRSVEVERLVEIGWVRDDRAAARRASPRVVPERQRGDERARCARIPSAAWRPPQRGAARGAGAGAGRTAGLRARARRATDAVSLRRAPRAGERCAVPRGGGAPHCGLCGRARAPGAVPNCDGTRLRGATAGASRTAEELGRAFPASRVILSDGERPGARASTRARARRRDSRRRADRRGRVPCRAAARRRADAACASRCASPRTACGGGRMRRRSRRRGRPCSSSASAGPRHARSRDVEAARVGEGRTRRRVARCDSRPPCAWPA